MPVQDAPLGRTDERVGGDAYRGEDEDRTEEDGQVEVRVGHEDHASQTAIGAGPFPDDSANEREVE